MKRHSIHLGNVWEPPTGDSDAARSAEPSSPQAFIQKSGIEKSGIQKAHTAWIRRFGRPAGIEPGDRVLLVCEQPATGLFSMRLTLNAVPLPAIGPDAPRWEHDITPLLRDRNELVLVPFAPAPVEPTRRDIHGRAALPPEWGRVSLDIVSD